MVNYGGDEVSALVLDIGTSSTRAGYAGDDTPKAIIPTSYGVVPSPDTDAQMGDTNQTAERRQVYLGHSGPSLWRANMEIHNPIVDGLIQDFNPIPALIRHAFEDTMRCSPSEHPVLVTEPAWNTPANRERMAEIMFEEFQVPAFYIANTGVLNTFAAGKGSALVIDIGQSMASVVPVVDGFVLRKGLAQSTLPQLVHAAARQLLTNPTQTRHPIDLSPHQLIASKQPVEPNAPPKYTLREDRVSVTSQSWRTWAENREVEEWVQSVAGVLDQGWNDQSAAMRPPRQYEFPTGFNPWFGPERFQIGEQFFWNSPQTMASPNPPRIIPNLISDSLRACEPELRQVLMGNVVLTGGGSLFAGFADRLANEMMRSFPHTKVHAPGNPIERRYGGWLGGSILASLGTFHQLWISREEWQEHGTAIVGQRCK
ncbi:actin-related protein Arp4p [Dendrothele bispora CBS 962.96]|uniref:Actin-related protein Arp4p n=1 Tax=Dendrothele bispora (strain CBS 962.96) TaxID=1314807 RepID=A0A4S8MKI8_DENBC|nr:actin-related protein Arp4p [Dendrothele bispora CBS 962.96]